jgi:hypothetical protein
MPGLAQRHVHHWRCLWRVWRRIALGKCIVQANSPTRTRPGRLQFGIESPECSTSSSPMVCGLFARRSDRTIGSDVAGYTTVFTYAAAAAAFRFCLECLVSARPGATRGAAAGGGCFGGCFGVADLKGLAALQSAFLFSVQGSGASLPLSFISEFVARQYS